MHFTIYHGLNKKTEVDQALNFDQLANKLSVLRKLDYSNIFIFHPKEKGLRIDNQPKEQCEVQTGFMQFDLYGCWYEVRPDDGSEKFWMIGNYPYNY